MSSLERVDCIFQFFGESPQFAVVVKYTCYICIEGSDFSAVKKFIQHFESIYCKNVSAMHFVYRLLMSFNVHVHY